MFTCKYYRIKDIEGLLTVSAGAGRSSQAEADGAEGRGGTIAGAEIRA